MIPPDYRPSNDLRRLAGILADWAAPAREATIYVFGSRVRGDCRPDSDLDIHVDWRHPTREDMDWWQTNNDEDFLTLRTHLGLRLEILDPRDDLRNTIVLAPVVYVDRNVRCVWYARRQPTSAVLT